MFEQLIIVGRVGRAPEMRYAPSGDPVTSFTVAVNEKWKDANGNRHEKTRWYRISAWSRLAEICDEFVKKGDRVMVIGTLQGDEKGAPRVWKDSNGNARASFEVRAANVVFLSSKSDRTEYSQEEDQESQEDEEIPF